MLLLYFPNTAVKYILVEKETDESSIAGESEPINRLLMSIRLHFCSCRAAQTWACLKALGIQDIHLEKWVLWYQGMEQSREERKSWCMTPLLCIQKGACRGTAQGNWAFRMELSVCWSLLSRACHKSVFLKNTKPVLHLAAKSLGYCGNIKQFSSVFTALL